MPQTAVPAAEDRPPVPRTAVPTAEDRPLVPHTAVPTVGASDGGPDRRPVNCVLLSTEDTDLTDNTSQPTISISLDSLDDDEDEDAPPTSSSSAESISHILSNTQLSVDPRFYYIHNGPVNKGNVL